MISETQKCKGFTLRGSLCKNFTSLEHGFCLSHQYQSRIKDSNLEEGICAICLERAEKYEALECGHLIHRKCIKQTQKVECPVCRAELHSLPHRIRKRIERNAQQAENDENNIMSLVYDIVRRAFSNPRFTRMDGVIAYYDESTDRIQVYFSNSEEPLETGDES